MNIQTVFEFALPDGNGIEAEPGHKVTGIMRLTQVKDVLAIEEEDRVLKGSSLFSVLLLSKTISVLGLEKTITRKTIEKLTSADFNFLVNFMHKINNQTIKHVQITCPSCNHSYMGTAIHAMMR